MKIDSPSITGNLTVSGSITVLTNLNVLGSQSVAYLSSSQLDIATNLITVNTSTPSLRFGGIAVRDSGSLATGRTGSLLWDSQNDVWIYSNPSGAAYEGGMLLTGPRNTNSLGNEVGISSGYAAVGDGSHHMTSSAIYSSGSLIRLEKNTQVTGSLDVSSGITGSLFGTSSWARNAVTASKVSGGSANYIPLWSDSVTLGSSGLYHNAFGQVGLNTASPNSTLHISSSIAQPLLNIQNAISERYTDIQFTGTGKNYVIGVGNSSETTLGVANEFFVYDATAGAVRMVIDNKGDVGIGTVTPGTALDVAGAVRGSSIIGYVIPTTGSSTTPPIRLTSGSNTSAVQAGAIEYDGTTFYHTNDTTSGRGYEPSIQIFRLTASLSAIGSAIANFFGPTSSIQLAGGGIYEIEAYCTFTKTTAGTVTVTVSSSLAPVNLNGILQYGAAAGGSNTGAANQIAIAASTATAAAFGASVSLATLAGHAFTIRLLVESNASNSNLRFLFTESAGTVTPLRGSYYKVTRLPSGNSGNFVT